MTSFYANKKVVVTGGAGMVGSALVEQLLDQGAHVEILDDLSRGKAWHPGSHISRIDAGNELAVRTHLRDAFALFNLAAYVAGVEFNQHNHALMFSQNIRLQTAPILAAAAVGVPHVLQTSSVCVYAPECNHPALEANGLKGEPHAANNGYAHAKRMGERVVGWSQLEHAVIVRPSNVYGPRDYFDNRAHVIPALIRKAIYDDVIKVNGSGFEEREFIYVDDVASGMLHALEHGAHQGVYNLGTNGETCVSIRKLVEIIKEAVYEPYKSEVYSQDFNSGDPARWSDCTNMLALGWQHEVGLDEGIRRTVEWYRKH